MTGGGIEGYVVYRKSGGGEWKELGRTKERSFVDKDVKEGRKYIYRVAGYNSGGVGESAESEIKIGGGGRAPGVYLMVGVVVAVVAAGVGVYLYLMKKRGEGKRRKESLT